MNLEFDSIHFSSLIFEMFEKIRPNKIELATLQSNGFQSEIGLRVRINRTKWIIRIFFRILFDSVRYFFKNVIFFKKRTLPTESQEMTWWYLIYFESFSYFKILKQIKTESEIRILQTLIRFGSRSEKNSRVFL